MNDEIIFSLDEKIPLDMIILNDKISSLENEIENLRSILSSFHSDLKKRESYIFEKIFDLLKLKENLELQSIDLDDCDEFSIEDIKKYLIKNDHIKYDIYDHSNYRYLKFKFYDKNNKLLINKYPKAWLFSPFEEELKLGYEKYIEEEKKQKEKKKENKQSNKQTNENIIEISENIKNKLSEEELNILSKLNLKIDLLKEDKTVDSNQPAVKRPAVKRPAVKKSAVKNPKKKELIDDDYEW